MSFPPTKATPIALSGCSSAPVFWQLPWPDLPVAGPRGSQPACRHCSVRGGLTLASPGSFSSYLLRPQDRLSGDSVPSSPLRRGIQEHRVCCPHSLLPSQRSQPAQQGRPGVRAGRWGLETEILAHQNHILVLLCDLRPFAYLLWAPTSSPGLGNERLFLSMPCFWGRPQEIRKGEAF